MAETPIQGKAITADTTAADLVDQFAQYGLQATNIAQGAAVIKKMKAENATIFLSFTSNMASSGVREVIAQQVKEKKVDAIITTIGAVEEDVMKAHKPFLVGSFNEDDVALHKQGTNRIGNILVPNNRYEQLESLLQPFFEKMLKRQEENKKLCSPQELIHELGKEIDDESSFVYWATKNNIPIYCPAPTDGALGLNIYFFKQKHPEFGIDVTADMQALGKQVLEADKTGAIILGGGVAKHHTIGVNILREGLDMAVYVSTAVEYDGSLSGAQTKEAISWSKISESADHVYIHADASIVFPLLVAATQ